MTRLLVFCFQLFAIVLTVCGDSEPDPTQAVVVTLNGQQFVNKGLVAFGLIPSDIHDAKGDTIGGIGSAMAIKYGTWRKHGCRFKGTFSMHPDRGFNINGTVDYQARRFDIDFELKPYYSAAPLSFTDAQKTLKLYNIQTIFEFERNHTTTTGLDATAVRTAERNFPADPKADPQMPISSVEFPHLSTDIEGIVSNGDGTFWVSDEYGPYIYHFTEQGKLIQTIQPPPAILPHGVNGFLNFTSGTNPTTGRGANQGFEGLTLDFDTQTLYALLQSGTVQDGAGMFTRLLAYDIYDAQRRRPTLTGEWIVPLPTSSSGKALGASEVHFVSENLLLALARDSDGRGGRGVTSQYKQADLVDISAATDIHNTKFDDPTHPVAVGGALDPSVIPATYIPFVNYLNVTQLARFGLHNGNPDDPTLIDGKWESLALAPCDDPAFPNDYFLFTASDNDFISTQGVFNGIQFNASLDNDNQFMVFRLTLPTVPSGSIARRIGAGSD